MPAEASFEMKCLRLMLKPIARFCARNGVTIQEFLEAGKQTLVDAAAEEMRSLGQKVNISRVSVMTGVHRRDVMRLRAGTEQAPATASVVSRVVGQWQHDKRFCFAPGVPRALSADGENNEFRSLVACISTDLNSGTVLFELERRGMIERVDGKVRLRADALSIRDDKAEGLMLAANDTQDLLGAVQENLASNDDVPNLHARTEYDNIDADKIPMIKDWLLREGGVLHQKAREFLAKYDHDIAGSSGRGVKVVLGTFSRVIEEENASA